MQRHPMSGVVVVCLLAAGCGAVSTFRARGAACPSLPDDCEVTVITSRPDRDYQVVGVLDIEAFSVRAIPRDEEAFLTLVRPEVCRAGGDAVIPGVNGDGRYVLATVVKWVEAGATEPVCVPDAGTPAAETPAASDAEAPAPAPPSADEAPAAPTEPPADAPSPDEPAASAGACRGGAPC